MGRTVSVRSRTDRSRPGRHSWAFDGFEIGVLDMKKNVGSLDSVMRVATGLVLIVATMFGLIGLWGWLGLIPLVTGLFRVCPSYMLSGFSTRTDKPDQPPP